MISNNTKGKCQFILIEKQEKIIATNHILLCEYQNEASRRINQMTEEKKLFLKRIIDGFLPRNFDAISSHLPFEVRVKKLLKDQKQMIEDQEKMIKIWEEALKRSDPDFYERSLNSLKSIKNFIFKYRQLEGFPSP